MALVESLADFAGEIAGRIRLLEDGQALALDLAELGHLGAVAGGENDEELVGLCAEAGISLECAEKKTIYGKGKSARLRASGRRVIGMVK